MLLRCFQKISLFNFTHPRNGVVSTRYSRGEEVFFVCVTCSGMSAYGPKRTIQVCCRMSAFGGKADVKVNALYSR